MKEAERKLYEKGYKSIRIEIDVYRAILYIIYPNRIIRKRTLE